MPANSDRAAERSSRLLPPEQAATEKAPRRQASTLCTHLADAVILDDLRSIVAVVRTRQAWRERGARQASGERVPNALLRPAESSPIRPSRRALAVNLALVAGTYSGVFMSFARLQSPIRPVLLDWATLTALVLVGLVAWPLLETERSARLRYLRFQRRRFGSPGPRRRGSPRGRGLHVWPIGALVGVIVYAALLAPVIGVAGTPAWLAHWSAVIGHARVAPVLVFPFLSEMAIRRFRRAHRRRDILSS